MRDVSGRGTEFGNKSQPVRRRGHTDGENAHSDSSSTDGQTDQMTPSHTHKHTYTHTPQVLVVIGKTKLFPTPL